MSVRRNKGAAGIDKMSVDALDEYMPLHMDEIKQSICKKQCKPSPVRCVFIPKPNGKQRPLGIPTVVDRVVQQATAQVRSRIYEPLFSDHSYGFRPNRNCHKAINQALEYLNAGYEWVVDFDIEKYFDTVNHDKLISILREQVNDSATLHLIRSFLKSGVMESGLVSATTGGKVVAYLRFCQTFTLTSSTRNLKVESYVLSVMRMILTYLSRAKGRRIG